MTTLADNAVKQMSKSAITRLFRRAGAVRMCDDVVAEIQSILMKYLKKVVGHSIILTEHRRRRTVRVVDLQGALEIHGLHLGAIADRAIRMKYPPKRRSTTSISQLLAASMIQPATLSTAQPTTSSSTAQPTTSSSTAQPSSQNQHADTDTDTDEDEDESESGSEKSTDDDTSSSTTVRTRRRARSGVAALRAVRRQQKYSESFFFLITTFQYLVRKVAMEFCTDLSFTADFMLLMQLCAEEYLTRLVQKAILATLHSDRITVMAKDLRLVQAMNDPVLCAYR